MKGGSYLANNQEEMRKDLKRRTKGKRKDKQIDEDLKRKGGRSRIDENLGREIVGLNCGEMLEDSCVLRMREGGVLYASYLEVIESRSQWNNVRVLRDSCIA